MDSVWMLDAGCWKWKGVRYRAKGEGIRHKAQGVDKWWKV
jgi:hypothetical protein